MAAATSSTRFLRLGLNRLEEFYKAAMPADGSVSVLRPDGMILAHYPHNEKTLGTRLPAIAPWYQAVAEGGGSYRSPGYIDGTVYTIAVHPLRDFPLVVDAVSTEESVLAIWRRQALFVAAGMALAAIAVVWLLQVFDRQLRRLFQQNLQLERSRMQFNAALDNISQGVTFIGVDEKLIVANRRYAEIYRLSPAILMPGHSLIAALQSRIENGSFPEVSLQAYRSRREALERDRGPFEIIEELCDGRTVVLRCQPLANGGWMTTHEDITARRRAKAELAFMARHDSPHSPAEPHPVPGTAGGSNGDERTRY